jgi:hypothetical protein
MNILINRYAKDARYRNTYSEHFLLTKEEVKSIQERISRMDETQLDNLIRHYREYEDKPLNYHNKYKYAKKGQ